MKQNHMSEQYIRDVRELAGLDPRTLLPRQDEQPASAKTALATVEHLPALPDIAEAEVVIRGMVEHGAVDQLDEARLATEAQALYERRAHNLERAQHYTRLQILAEAGLGALSFDDNSVGKGNSQRTRWRRLGAALERGRLLDLMDHVQASEGKIVAESVAWEVVVRGLDYVPYEAFGGEDPDEVFPPWAWRVARGMARDAGTPFADVPCDDGAYRRRKIERKHQDARRAQRRKRAEIALAQKERLAEARQLGGGVGDGYATLVALCETFGKLTETAATVAARDAAEMAIHYLYQARDHAWEMVVTADQTDRAA